MKTGQLVSPHRSSRVVTVTTYGWLRLVLSLSWERAEDGDCGGLADERRLGVAGAVRSSMAHEIDSGMLPPEQQQDAARRK